MLGIGIEKMKKIKQFFAWIDSKIEQSWRWCKGFFIKEFEVTIWVDPMKKTVYLFRRLDKVTPTHIRGLFASGELFELHTQEEFNYQIVEKEPCWD